ncbi:protein kinase domain-containing protein [Acinetobacter sp. LoGeW2-3]|uniref:protein kinase domain-containing protein n=1 Tax=Acinetobacter sp. LoGeW2-3 TaxID=1808001 RepID=UPI001D18AAF8|nr:protein kinase [Acinetobacter sp. LoGeW2-3]
MISSRDLNQIKFELNTKPRSLAFGRRLYKGSLGQQTFWLKVQQQDSTVNSQRGFENEFAFYRTLSINSQAKFLVPHLLINSDIVVNGEIFRQGIFLQDCPSHFAINPHDLSLKEIQAHLLAALDAVMNLYQGGYLHHDLKAEHFVQCNGRVCLIDFEQARRIIDVPSQMLDATLRYMAPELFHAEAKTIQSDIYALGIIWLEWFSQARLSARTYEDWAYLHCQRLEIRLPNKFKTFQSVLEGMLSRHKSSRFSDFEQIKAALLTVID